MNPVIVTLKYKLLDNIYTLESPTNKEVVFEKGRNVDISLLRDPYGDNPYATYRLNDKYYFYAVPAELEKRVHLLTIEEYFKEI